MSRNTFSGTSLKNANTILLALFGLVSLASSQFAPCDVPAWEEQLEASLIMPPSIGAIEVAIPLETFWNFFSLVPLWPTWNHLFNATYTK